MYPTTIEDDVLSILLTVKHTSKLDKISSDVDLIGEGFDMDAFFNNLDLDRPADATHFGSIVHHLDTIGQTIRGRVWEMATNARLRRLLYAYMSIGGNVPQRYNERQRWWFGLVVQIFWWHTREIAINDEFVLHNRELEEALRKLLKHGVLNLESIAKNNKENAQKFSLITIERGISKSTADSIYHTLVNLAESITTHFGSRPQRVLRDKANEFADDITSLLDELSKDGNISSNAVRMWLRTMTGLPITVWSPSVNSFLDKFKSIGVNEDSLAALADTFGYEVVDQSFTGFMNDMCENCNPNNPEDQRCVRHFIDTGWQVECPMRPDFASQYRFNARHEGRL